MDIFSSPFLLLIWLNFIHAKLFEGSCPLINTPEFYVPTFVPHTILYKVYFEVYDPKFDFYPTKHSNFKMVDISRTYIIYRNPSTTCDTHIVLQRNGTWKHSALKYTRPRPMDKLCTLPTKINTQVLIEDTLLLIWHCVEMAESTHEEALWVAGEISKIKELDGNFTTFKPRAAKMLKNWGSLLKEDDFDETVNVYYEQNRDDINYCNSEYCNFIEEVVEKYIDFSIVAYALPAIMIVAFLISCCSCLKRNKIGIAGVFQRQ